MKNYAYEITEEGYYILKNGIRIIHQYGEYILDKTKSLEENALAQIEELKQAEENVTSEISTAELQEQITEIQLAMIELAESKEV